MQQTPPSLRAKAVRLIAAKSTLLARVDAYGQDPSVGGRLVAHRIMCYDVKAGAALASLDT